MATSDMSQEITVFSEELESQQEVLKGAGVSIQFGYFLSNSISFEIGHSSINFESYEGAISSPIIGKYEMIPKLDILSYGIRWFVWESLNFRIGGSRTEYDPKLQLTPDIEGVGSTTLSSTGSYYGGGVGVTFKKMQLFLDHTQYPKADSANPSLTEIGIRVFF
jgi:hypothetical protein